MQKFFAIFAVALSLELALGQQCRTVNKRPGVCKQSQSCPEIELILNITNKKPEDNDFLRTSAEPCRARNGVSYYCCSIIPQTPHCALNIGDKIFGGNEAEIGGFPWTAMLMYETRNVMAPGCGGALISSRYVLTAAHCVTALRSGRFLMEVRLGEHDIRTDIDCNKNGDECTTHVDVDIEVIYVHKDFNLRLMKNDIALVRLSREVEFTDHIQPICLPSSLASYDHKKLYVAGWGKTENGTASPVKMQVSVPVVPFEDCSAAYAANEVYRQEIYTSQLCAGGIKGKDSCAGDSGGPLVYLNMKYGVPHWEAVGIVSFGPNACGIKGVPGVYTKIFDFIEWIYRNVEP